MPSRKAEWDKSVSLNFFVLARFMRNGGQSSILEGNKDVSYSTAPEWKICGQRAVN